MAKRMLSLIRNAVALTGLFRTKAYIKYYRMRRGKENISHLLERKPADRFAKIYETGVWLNERVDGSLSGLGSEVEKTNRIREELPKILARLEVKSLLDVGCGDWNWMRHVKLPCEYIGVDIVPSVIESNVTRFGGQGKRFMVLNAIDESLPDCDAILLREVIFHLSFADARSLIRNILKSHARYLFVTTDSHIDVNIDIRTGDFRNLNLRLKPFFFPEPVLEIPDDGVFRARRVALWNLDDFRAGGVTK